jgi:hypothetical protein
MARCDLAVHASRPPTRRASSPNHATPRDVGLRPAGVARPTALRQIVDRAMHVGRVEPKAKPDVPQVRSSRAPASPDPGSPVIRAQAPIAVPRRAAPCGRNPTYGVGARPSTCGDPEPGAPLPGSAGRGALFAGVAARRGKARKPAQTPPPPASLAGHACGHARVTLIRGTRGAWVLSATSCSACSGSRC